MGSTITIPATSVFCTVAQGVDNPRCGQAMVLSDEGITSTADPSLFNLGVRKKRCFKRSRIPSSVELFNT